MAAGEISEAFARAIFLTAIREQRCSEMLECLFDGGSATVDARTGKLCLATAEQLAQMIQHEADQSAGSDAPGPPDWN